MMKLYFSPGACSMAPHIVLHELGAQFQSEKVDLKEKKTSTGESYLGINPKGQVPALKTSEGKLLTENAVIMQYMADQYTEKNLLPKWGTWERYQANEWLNYVATEIHKGMGVLFAADRLVPSKEGNAEFRKNAVAALGKKFDHLSNHFKEHLFLLGDQFSAADAYLFTILNWHGWLKVDLTPWPALLGFMERVKARPAVQATMKAEGLI
jgi:glutathione S-transferase